MVRSCVARRFGGTFHAFAFYGAQPNMPMKGGRLRYFSQDPEVKRVMGHSDVWSPAEASQGYDRSSYTFLGCPPLTSGTGQMRQDGVVK